MMNCEWKFDVSGGEILSFELQIAFVYALNELGKVGVTVTLEFLSM